MKKYILLLSAAALCLAACTQKADHFDYGQEIALITGTDASPVSKDQILYSAMAWDVVNASKDLMMRALQNGGKDNITLIVAHVSRGVN